MNLRHGVRSRDLSDRAEEITKIYKRAVDYFKNTTEGFVVESPVANRYFSLRKRGSDLGFKLNIGDFDNIYLEVMKIDATMDQGRGFSKSIVGTIEYLKNGKCENKRNVCLPNKRQQEELQDMIEHVQRSLRPNAINFIMDS